IRTFNHPMIFTRRWPLTDPGSTLAPTADVGGRRTCGRIGARTPSGTGNGRMPAGTGPAMKRGVGLVFIMASGFMIRVMAGYGCREPNGHPHGSFGAKPRIISAGRPADLAALP